MAAPGEVVTSGWFKALEEGKFSRSTINRIFRVQMCNATKSYMTDQSNDGFQLRFKNAGFSMLGLYQRSSDYQKRQLSQYKQTLPFFGPRNKGQKGIPHMRDLLKVMGTGYNITPTSTQYSIKIKLTLPGARKMNQGQGKYYQDYASQLIGWNAGARWQVVQIMQTSIEKSLEEIIKTAK